MLYWEQARILAFVTLKFLLVVFELIFAFRNGGFFDMILAFIIC